MAGQFGTPLDQNFDYQPFYKSMQKAGADQSRYNNPNTVNPWSEQIVNPDGSTSTNFLGQFGQLNDSLTNQAAQSASTPLNFGQFGVSDGSAAGQQAAQAAFGQARSRLDPMWQKSEHNMRRNAFQSGMADGTAMDNNVAEFGRARNDAYSSAMGDALRQGMSAQQSAFGGNLASRQMDVDNQVRAKTQPWEDLSRMQGFLGQPDYNKSNAGMVAAAQGNSQADARAVQSEEERMREQVLAAGGDDAWKQKVAGMNLDDLNGYWGAYGSLVDTQNKNMRAGGALKPGDPLKMFTQQHPPSNVVGQG